VIGGLVTGRVTRKLDEDRREHARARDDEREHEITFWLMDAYSDQMGRAAALIIWTLEEGRFPPFAGLIHPLRPDDRIRVMRQLDTEEREALFTAELSADLLIAQDSEVAGKLIGGDTTRDRLKESQESFETLKRALDRHVDRLGRGLGISASFRR
jgi:hypothetical protein